MIHSTEIPEPSLETTAVPAHEVNTFCSQPEQPVGREKLESEIILRQQEACILTDEINELNRQIQALVNARMLIEDKKLNLINKIDSLDRKLAFIDGRHKVHTIKKRTKKVNAETKKIIDQLSPDKLKTLLEHLQQGGAV